MQDWFRVTLIASVALGGALVGLAVLALPTRASQTADPPPAPAVRVATVEAAPLTRPVRLLGITRARDRARPAFTLGGRLVERPVDVGDPVEAGQVLARLDPAPLAHRVAEARARVVELEARLGQLSADRARLDQLRADRAVSIAEQERLASQERGVAAGLDQARVGLREALRQQREGVLRAPHAGTVAEVHAEPGDTVAGGNPVVTLAGAGVEVVVEAPEPVWARLSTAEAPIRATVALPGLGCTAPAMPTAVARAAGGPGALFPVHLDVPSTSDCPVVPGLTAAADLALPRPPGLAVPVRAVVAPTGDDPAVFRVREGRAERVSIAPGELLGDTVAVDGGLEAGDEVVVAGLVGLVDAAAVEVVR